MNFPRREEATNKELILTIIDIQGHLMRYGKSHTNWHETLNEVIERLEQTENDGKGMTFEEKAGIVISQLRADRDRLQENIKALGEDMRICQKTITDEKVLIGFNMAVALCNKHLAESEDDET